jgi:1-deoxy-D-xylulose-5-phosphate synthase
MADAAEIRRMIIDTVSANGGHLASSLGAVEIAMALSDVFEPEHDRIVWDVGHQAYAWKILTGREREFSTLRKLGGISGFPNPAESPADAAVAGHANVIHVLHLSNGLSDTQSLGRKASQNVVFGVIGKRHESLHLSDALIDE